MMDSKVWFKIEELIPAERSISKEAFWYQLNLDGQPFRTMSLTAIEVVTRKLLDEGRKVRAVRVTEEVVDVP